MEFTQKNAQSQPTHNQPSAQVEHDAPTSDRKKSHGTPSGWLRLAAVVLLFSITILMVAIAWLLYAGNDSELQYADTTKFQAVVLDASSTGSSPQVYYGHIVRLNDKYLVLRDVYYTVPVDSTTTSATTPSTTKTPTTPTTPATSTTTVTGYTPVQLGCELRAPYDQLVINRDQVAIWENIRSDQGIGLKLTTYEQQNPNGVACNTSSTPSLNSVAPVPSADNTP